MVDLNVRIAEIVQRLAAKSGDAGSIDAETWNAYVGDKGGKTIKSHIDTKNAAAALTRYFQQCSSADNNGNDLIEKWFDQTVTDEIGKKYLDFAKHKAGELFDVIGDDGRADPETARMKYLEFGASCIKAVDKEYGNGDGTLTVDEYKKYLGSDSFMAQFVDTDDCGTIDKYEFTARELYGYDTQNGGTYKDRYNYRGQLTLKANLDPDLKKQLGNTTKEELLETAHTELFDKPLQERIDQLKQDTE